MIYDYFGGVEGVLNLLLKDTDILLSYEDEMAETIQEHKNDYGKRFTMQAFERHFVHMKLDPLLQAFGLLELSDDDQFLSSLAEKRERLGDQLFSISKDYFKDSNVNFRAICAILSSGINHLVLHSKMRKSPYCGININQPEDQKTIIDTVNLIIEAAYKEALKKV